MEAVDQLAHVQQQVWQHGISLNTRPAKPLNFTFCKRLLNAPGPILLEEGVHEVLALVVDHSAGEVFSEKLRG